LEKEITSRLIYKHNKLIESAHRLSLQEQRVLLLMISLINGDDEDFKSYVFDVKEFAKMMGYKGQSIYSEVKKVTKKLITRVLEIEDLENRRLLQISWVSSAEYVEETGSVEISFDPKLKPYLLKLKERYTKYSLLHVIRLRSAYSVRIYELLKQVELFQERSFVLTDLRKLLGIKEDEYKLYADFRRKVLEHSIKEINEKTDLRLSYETEKRGRGVNKIKFLINSKGEKQKALPGLEAISNKQLYEDLIKKFNQHPSQAREYLKTYPEYQIAENLKHVERRVRAGEINDIGAYTRKAITDDIKDQLSLFDMERAQTRQHELEKKEEERLAAEYQNYKDQEIDRLKGSYSDELLAQMEKEAEATAIEKHGRGIGLKMMARLELHSKIAEENNLLSLEEWIEEQQKH